MTTNSNIRLPAQRNAASQNAFRDLRASGMFGRLPIIGITMFLFGSLIFGALAYNVNSDALLQWDTAITQTLHFKALHIPPPLMEYLIFGFFLGREIVILLATILGVYFIYKRFWRELAMVLFGPGLGGILWYFLSRLFDRPRPTTQMEIILSDPSFPSGHTLTAVVFYGLLAYLLVPRISSRFWKWSVAILLAFITLFIGFSRLLLGGHYLSDVIAGYAVGIAWAGLIYTLMERFFSAGIVREQEHTLKNAPFAGLRTPGMFKRFPLLGILLIVLGSLSLAALGYSLIHQGSLVQWDQSIYKTLIVKAKAAPPRLNELMIFGFFVGKQVILVLVTLLSIYFIYKRFWQELAMLLISSAGGSLVWDVIVNYFARPRPAEQTGLAVTTIPSFPSGHAMSLVICYGFLAYLLIPKMPSRAWKWTLAIVTLAIILFGGFSRIFQGSHYLTDILAGYALGIAWAALVYTLIEIFFLRKKV